MSLIRLCICPCGRVSVQETDKDILCYKCGDRYQPEITSFNLDAKDLKVDLTHALELANTFHDKKEAEQISTETKLVTGGVATVFDEQKQTKQ